MSEPALKLEPLEAAPPAPQGKVIPLPTPPVAAPAPAPPSEELTQTARRLWGEVLTMFRSPLKGQFGDQLKEAQKSLILSRAVVLIWISHVVMPTAIWGYTYFMAPQHLPSAVGIVLAAIAATQVLRLAINRGVFDTHYHLTMLVLVGGIFGITGSAILELTLGAESNFFFAFFLIYFAFTSLFPAEVLWILATSGALVASYLGVGVAWPGPFEMDAMVTSHLIYLLELTFIGVVLNRVITKLFFDERLAQIELGRANDELRELDKAKTTFFSNISHELRTPLTLILTPLTHMVRHGADELNLETVDKLKGMRGNANRLLKMVNSLLDFARLEAGRVDVITNELLLDDVLGHIASLFRGTAEQRGIHFLVDNQCEGEYITSDLDMLEQMLVNLVGNALKFTPADGTITLGAKPTESQRFALFVTDTGVGIAPEHQQLVFRRFAQVQQDQNVSVRGTGIGLAMVQEYARLLTGTVRLESERGVGSTFTIDLPRVSDGISRDPEQSKSGDKQGKANDSERLGIDADLALADLVQEQAGDERERNLAPEGARRVLVVDDNPDLVRLVSSILEARYNLYLAYNGEEALERLASDTVDLVVSDVMMPGISGLELCERIRANEATQHIPVILLTARGGSAEKVEGLDIGADDYIGKPFDPEELLARIRSLFERRRLLSDLQQKSTELENMLERLKAEEVKLVASEKLRVMGDLAAGIFHELHNYMNMIYNGAQPLKELVAEQLERIEDIDPEDVESIDELIDLMLEASNAALSVTGELKAYAHQTANLPKKLDLHDHIRSCIRMFGALKADANVHFEFHEGTLMLECVPSRLLMLFTNLTKNAFEAMDDGGSVSILTEPLPGGGAVVKVRDTGPGVPESFREKLFQPFHSTKKQGEGLGLGLSLALKVVEEMGGQMTYDETYTDGAQFLIKLPDARWT